MKTVENLNVIIEILRDFENISGLGCNLDKTVVMPVGSIENVPQEVLNLGLQFVPEITLLGAKIKNTGVCFDDNSVIILEKIRKQSNFWRRFNLSLPGRINIAKTFMYSQINYLGCFLPFTNVVLQSFSLEIEKFVRGNLQIGKNKIYAPLEHGGLGLFKINEFLQSQCCAWVRRSANLDELWKREFF